jgi:hypothetical protein
LSVAADLMGAIGSGTGILMAVTIIYSCQWIFFNVTNTQLFFATDWELGMRVSILISLYVLILMSCRNREDRKWLLLQTSSNHRQDVDGERGTKKLLSSRILVVTVNFHLNQKPMHQANHVQHHN